MTIYQTIIENHSFSFEIQIETVEARAHVHIFPSAQFMQPILNFIHCVKLNSIRKFTLGRFESDGKVSYSNIFLILLSKNRGCVVAFPHSISLPQFSSNAGWGSHYMCVYQLSV